MNPSAVAAGCTNGNAATRAKLFTFLAVFGAASATLTRSSGTKTRNNRMSLFMFLSKVQIFEPHYAVANVVQDEIAEPQHDRLQEAEEDHDPLQTNCVPLTHWELSLFPHQAAGFVGVEAGCAALAMRVLVPWPGKTFRFAFGPKFRFAGVSTVSSAMPQGERAGTPSPGLKRNWKVARMRVHRDAGAVVAGVSGS